MTWVRVCPNLQFSPAIELMHECPVLCSMATGIVCSDIAVRGTRIRADSDVPHDILDLLDVWVLFQDRECLRIYACRWSGSAIQPCDWSAETSYAPTTSKDPVQRGKAGLFSERAKTVYSFMIAHCSGLSRFVELLKGFGAASKLLPIKCPFLQDNAGFERDARHLG